MKEKILYENQFFEYIEQEKKYCIHEEEKTVNLKFMRRPPGVRALIMNSKNNEVKTTKRSTSEKKYFQKRLKIIEGQVRGVIGMVEDDRYCNDILIQISAINKSLKSLSNEMLKSHLTNCVATDIKNDNLEIIDEVMMLIKNLS